MKTENVVKNDTKKDPDFGMCPDCGNGFGFKEDLFLCDDCRYSRIKSVERYRSLLRKLCECYKTNKVYSCVFCRILKKAEKV